VASLSQGRTAAAQCGLFTHKSVPVIFEPPCNFLPIPYTLWPNYATLNCVMQRHCAVMATELLRRYPVTAGTNWPSAVHTGSSLHFLLSDFSPIFPLTAFLVVPGLNEAPSHEEKIWGRWGAAPHIPNLGKDVDNRADTLNLWVGSWASPRSDIHVEKRKTCWHCQKTKNYFSCLLPIA